MEYQKIPSKFKKHNIVEKIKKYITLKLMLGIVLGGLSGFLYYYYIGCSSGSCPITSNPWSSIVYGSFFGGLIGFKKKEEVKKPDSSQE